MVSAVRPVLEFLPYSPCSSSHLCDSASTVPRSPCVSASAVLHDFKVSGTTDTVCEPIANLTAAVASAKADDRIENLLSQVMNLEHSLNFL